MALILVACIVAFSGNTLLADAQTCVDGSAFKEQVLSVGQQEPPYRLTCPLEAQSPPLPHLTWQKDCQPLPSMEGKAYLAFANFSSADQGNYSCMQQGNSSSSFTTRLIVKSRCSEDPEFKRIEDTLYGNIGSTVTLNCTALLFWDPTEEHCDTTLQWSTDHFPLPNHIHYALNASWSPAAGQLMVTSLLEINLKEQEDFGLYICTVRNYSSLFRVSEEYSIIACGGPHGPNHIFAVLAAIVLLLLLAVAAVVYSRCHLNIKLWYKNSYGDYELSDGKLFDAYISYVNNDHDRKFVNFILKPHLENKNVYKVHLNDNAILPGSEPSAELLMNLSRSRRLIVLLSYAYLEQDWCCDNFRQGLLHLLELCPRPILILLEGQSKRMRPEIKQLLNDHQHCLTVLTWKHNSVTPSSVFWKELALAMPRRIVFRSSSACEPQTLLHNDKDPMLTLDSNYRDSNSDTDPAGDLGLRPPLYKTLASKAPVLPVAHIPSAEPRPTDIDVSDLGTRNYGARSDFYCLVTEEDI